MTDSRIEEAKYGGPYETQKNQEQARRQTANNQPIEGLTDDQTEQPELAR